MTAVETPCNGRDEQTAGDCEKAGIEIAWPAIPSVALKSCAIGVNKLTGMNSEAINIATHSAIEPTALQICRSEMSGCIVVVAVMCQAAFEHAKSITNR
jgi:hypothetical protein